MKNNVTLKGCVVEKCIRISALFSAFRQVFGKDYYFGGETHDFWELVCVVEGAIGVRLVKMFSFWRQARRFCTGPWNSIASGRRRTAVRILLW